MMFSLIIVFMSLPLQKIKKEKKKKQVCLGSVLPSNGFPLLVSPTRGAVCPPSPHPSELHSPVGTPTWEGCLAWNPYLLQVSSAMSSVWGVGVDGVLGFCPAGMGKVTAL